jgi:hypothetical protein
MAPVAAQRGEADGMIAFGGQEGVWAKLFIYFFASVT